MAGTRTEKVRARDGGEFDAHIAVPESGSGPGILLIQEIFGVNDYVKARAEKLAGLGHVVSSPDVFWRIQPNIALAHDEAGVQKGIELGARLDVPKAVADLAEALDHLRGLPEVRGRTGVMGFCLGGTLAYFVAVEADPDAAVSYYGSAVPGSLDLADRIKCPILFHFGGADPYITRESVDRAAAELGARENVEFHIHEGAGHAFDNYLAPMFSNPEAAERAWAITVDFLDRNCGPAEGRSQG
jgi:carboxymethylenebutenolidase